MELYKTLSLGLAKIIHQVNQIPYVSLSVGEREYKQKTPGIEYDIKM